MGCCLSTKNSPKSNHQNHVSRPHLQEFNTKTRAPPPPPPLEEETVKEVLSETPIPKTLNLIRNDNGSNDIPHQQQQKIPEVEEVKMTEPAADFISDDVSEVSEVRTFSESLSTVATEYKDDDGEVTQRLRRSPAKAPRKRPGSGDFHGGKLKGVRSPARRLEPSPSPVKRTNVPPRSTRGRATTAARRNVGPMNALHRDAGESSGRRSRSPLTRSDVGAGARRTLRHKSPTVTTSRAAGGRTAVGAVDNGAEREKGNSDALPETTRTTTRTESLEDPLVSLECFIFL